jgi:hypothetical protein
MLTPILNWSTTVRRHKAQAIVLYWGLLIFVALIAVIVRINLYDTTLNRIESIVSCPTNKVPRCEKSDFIGQFLTVELYQRCQYTDFCSLLGPRTPMRCAVSMVAVIRRAWALKSLEDKRFLFISSAAYLQAIPLVFIILQGLIGLLGYGSSQSEVRNAISMVWLVGPKKLMMSNLNKSNGDKIPDVLRRLARAEGPNTPNTLQRRQREAIAKLSAASVYVVALLGAFACPFVFI